MVDGERRFEVIDEECVGCNLCVNVCPVENCITMEQLPAGDLDSAPARMCRPKSNWTMHPNNPMRDAAE